MKRTIIISMAVFLIVSCGQTSTDNQTNKDTTSTATDTISNVTNPGVGAVQDDTASKP